MLADLQLDTLDNSRLKSLVRGNIWREKVSKDIVGMVRNCSYWKLTKDEPAKVPAHCWEPPMRPFEKRAKHVIHGGSGLLHEMARGANLEQNSGQQKITFQHTEFYPFLWLTMECCSLLRSFEGFGRWNGAAWCCEERPGWTICSAVQEEAEKSSVWHECFFLCIGRPSILQRVSRYWWYCTRQTGSRLLVPDSVTLHR